MSAETLSNLEAAIQAHLEDTGKLDDGWTMTGFIVGAEAQKMHDDGVVGYGNDYIVSLGMSPNASSGLATYLVAVMDDAVTFNVGIVVDEDDD